MVLNDLYSFLKSVNVWLKVTEKVKRSVTFNTWIVRKVKGNRLKILPRTRIVYLLYDYARSKNHIFDVKLPPQLSGSSIKKNRNHSETIIINLDMSKEGLLVNCLTSERRTLLWVRSNPDRGCRILFLCKTMILLCQRPLSSCSKTVDTRRF